LKSLLQKHGLRGHKAPPAEMDNPSLNIHLKTFSMKITALLPAPLRKWD